MRGPAQEARPEATRIASSGPLQPKAEIALAVERFQRVGECSLPLIQAQDGVVELEADALTERCGIIGALVKGEELDVLATPLPFPSQRSFAHGELTQERL